MKTIYSILSVILLIALLAGYSLFAQADSPGNTVQDQSTPDSLLSESEVLLADIQGLTRKSAELRAEFNKAPEADYILFISLLGSMEDSLRGKLDRLIAIKQIVDKEKADTVSLQQAVQSIIVQQSTVLQQEINSLTAVVTKLRHKKSKRESLQFIIDRAELGVNELLAEWQKNIQRGQALQLDVDEDSKQFNQFLQVRAIGLAGRVRLVLDAIKALNERMQKADAEQQKILARQLYELENRKRSHASNLGNMVALMKKQGLETTDFGKVLVVATGDILNENVDTRAVVGIFQSIFYQSLAWLKENIPMIIFRMITFLLILVGFKLLAGIVSRVVERAVTTSHLQSSQLLKDFFRSMAAKTVMLIGLVIALSQLGIEIGPLLAGMGVIGFVVGFALQDALSNFASGMMILIYRPFDIGDVVEVAGISGTVHKMNLVSTTILTFDHQRMIIPNNKIWGDIITNVTAERMRRIDLVFRVGYTDNISRAEQVLHDIIETHELILTDPQPLIKVHKLGESSVEFAVRPWVNSKDYWTVYWDITRLVKDRFDETGMSIPYPQRDVHVYSASG